MRRAGLHAVVPPAVELGRLQQPGRFPVQLRERLRRGQQFQHDIAPGDAFGQQRAKARRTVQFLSGQPLGIVEFDHLIVEAVRPQKDPFAVGHQQFQRRLLGHQHDGLKLHPQQIRTL